MDVVRLRAREALRAAGVLVNTPGVELLERLGGGRWRYTTWIINVRVDAWLQCSSGGCRLERVELREPAGPPRAWTPETGWASRIPAVAPAGVKQ